MALFTRGYIRMNSRDDMFLEDEDIDRHTTGPALSDLKDAAPLTSHPTKESYSVGSEVNMNGVMEIEPTASMAADPKHTSVLPSQQRRPSTRLAAGTFEYEASANDIDSYSPLLLVGKVVMDNLLDVVATAEYSTRVENEYFQGTSDENAATTESDTWPWTGQGDDIDSPMQHTEPDDMSFDDSQKERMLHDKSTGASVVLLIAVLLGSVLLVALVIGLAVAGAKLLEESQKQPQKL